MRLIHGDLHPWNVLYAGGRAGAVDFDDCGDGYWLYDLAVTLVSLGGASNAQALHEALLTGYRQIRPLPAAPEARIEILVALRTLQNMLWEAEEREKPEFRDNWRPQMTH
jgi:Ser/Thr protein kinase RdoA (MazF antagonist)